MTKKKKAATINDVGISFPALYCDGDDGSISHYFTNFTSEIWRCKKCWAVKWLPAHWRDSERMSYSIRGKGLERTYGLALSHRPEIYRLLVKLDELRAARRYLKDEDFVKFVKDAVGDIAFRRLNN